MLLKYMFCAHTKLTFIFWCKISLFTICWRRFGNEWKWVETITWGNIFNGLYTKLLTLASSKANPLISDVPFPNSSNITRDPQVDSFNAIEIYKSV